VCIEHECNGNKYSSCQTARLRLLVLECLDAVKRSTTKYKLTLMWVPGHTGIAGNGIADQLARKAQRLDSLDRNLYSEWKGMD
jgi:ribonuclease HI